jgi:hypothetical protein
MFKNLAAMVLAIIALCACSAMPAGQGGQGGAEGVAAAAEKLRVLMVDPDRAQLEAIISEDLSYGHSGGKIDTRTSFIADLLSGKSDFVNIDITDQTVKVSQNAAVVRHTLTANTLDSGKPGTVKINILQVWQQQGGTWKLLARQAIRLPS